MIYLMFASIFITVKSIQAELADNTFSVTDLFKNQLFFTLIVSLLSTYVLYFLVSFLFFDPWHMFTSVSCLTLDNVTFLTCRLPVHPIPSAHADIHQYPQRVRFLQHP